MSQGSRSRSSTDLQLCVSHLGYRTFSPKTLTLAGGPATGGPSRIPFYIRQNCFRMPRAGRRLPGFSERFPAPYDLLRGRLQPRPGTFYERGELRRVATRWGVFWQADFSHFRQPGSFQIETDAQVSMPFMISDQIYDRVLLGYLSFLRAQRCGCDVFGVHPACHLDDGVLDTNGRPWRVTGGWHDAGDFRKWLAFTLYHIETLAAIHERRNPALPDNGGPYSNPVLNEIAWGNRFFHRMITRAGRVFEDVGGGGAPPGSALNYERHWWFENLPGSYGDAADNRWTDNRPGSGDERKVRTTYNPLVQFAFVHVQCRAAAVLPGRDGRRCLSLAERAWRYGCRVDHDGRTLFVAAQLRAALELFAARSTAATWDEVESLAEKLLARQETGRHKLSGYFLEDQAADAFRSIAFPAEPCLALLRLCELRAHQPRSMAGMQRRAAAAVTRFIGEYLLVDATSNPFGITPYGVYLHRPHTDRQVFRDAGGGRGVRTFVHPFNELGSVHGTGGVLLSHAHLLARAGAWFKKRDWQTAAERLLQWSLGHNPVNRSLFVGIGYRQPVGYSFRITQLPEAAMVGFIGRPDDTPYVEESTAIEWNTLEYWSVPYLHAAAAVCYLTEST